MHWNNDQNGGDSTTEESFITWLMQRKAMYRHSHSVLKPTFKHILLSPHGESVSGFLLSLSLPRDLFIISGHNHTCLTTHNHTYGHSMLLFILWSLHILVFGHFLKTNYNDAFVFMLGINFLQTICKYRDK